MRPLLAIVGLVVGAALGGTAHAQDLRALRPAIEARYPGVPWIGPSELAAALAREDGGRPLLLDARSRAEYDVSHLSRAVRVDPDRFDAGALEVPREAVIVVYCAVGWRSAGVAARLREAGFTNVRNLEGGIFRWANEGRPVYRRGERVREVHPYDATWGRLLRAELRARALSEL